MSERWVANSACIECYNIKARERYKENPEKYRAKRLKNRNKERESETFRRYYEENKEKFSEKARRYRKQHPQYFAAKAAERRARLQSPIWVDDSERQAIKEFYLNCPEGHHVDHIIPLNGETICGLHVIENLQYLPASENLSKKNKLVGDKNSVLLRSIHPIQIKD